jgi:hypothetical protein
MAQASVARAAAIVYPDPIPPRFTPPLQLLRRPLFPPLRPGLASRSASDPVPRRFQGPRHDRSGRSLRATGPPGGPNRQGLRSMPVTMNLSRGRLPFQVTACEMRFDGASAEWACGCEA